MPAPTVFVAILAIAHRPASFAGPSGFVTNPACFATHTPHNDVGAGVVNRVAQVGNVVVYFGIANGAVLVGFATIVATATGCTVEPHFELIVTIGSCFSTLREEHLLGVIIGIIAVFILFTPVTAVAVPGRNVEAVFQLKFLSCLGKILRNIGLFTKFITCVFHTVICRLCWPQAETIVVFNHRDATLHAGFLCRFEPLFGIGLFRRGKQRAIFIAVTPLTSGIGVHTIVEEGIELRFVPL